MKHAFGRARARSRKRWAQVGAAGIAAALLYWLLPFGDDGAELRLLLAVPGEEYAEELRVPAAWADTSTVASGATVRVPLLFAIVNLGGEAATPGRLELSLPSRFNLVRADGQPLPGRIAPGSPLVRYEVPVSLPRVEADGEAMPIAMLDTLWLEPVIPSFYCVTMADSVPDFVPAPPAPVEAIARVQIFYSFEGGDLESRQTGLLTVQLDPRQLEREAPDPPPVFPASFREPFVPRPPLGELSYGGSRRAFCGEPDLPIELLSTLWLTPGGGRFIVLDHGGVPRKYLFDLNADSIIELEMWDPDGDGDFEAWRQARMPIPAFLLPPPIPPQPDYGYLLAGMSGEDLVAYDRYHGSIGRPYEPRTAPPDTTRRTDRFRPMLLAGVDDSRRDREADQTYTGPVGPRLLGDPVDASGRRPPRPRPPVTRPAEPAPEPGRAPAPRRGGDAPAPPVAPARPEPAAADTAGQARPEPAEGDREPRPRRREPKLLGVPVDSIRGRR